MFAFAYAIPRLVWGLSDCLLPDRLFLGECILVQVKTVSLPSHPGPDFQVHNRHPNLTFTKEGRAEIPEVASIIVHDR